jgi:hypothetical protein
MTDARHVDQGPPRSKIRTKEREISKQTVGCVALWQRTISPLVVGWALQSLLGNAALEQYHHERRQPGDKIARSNKELERFQHHFLIPVTLKTL